MTPSCDDIPGYLILRGGGTLLALEAAVGNRPVILYAGPDLPGAGPEELALLATRQHAPGSPLEYQRGSMMQEMGVGVTGPAGLAGHRTGTGLGADWGKDWALDLRVSAVRCPSPNEAELECEDTRCGIAARHILSLDPSSGVIAVTTQIENRGDSDFALEWCAALCLPFDARLTRFLSFTGRWAGEFQIEEVPAFQGSILRENKAGRTSHDAFPGGILAAPGTGEMHGLAAGFHLAWSGNHRLRVDRHSDGRGYVQGGELLFPGEVCMAPGESYRTPEFLAVWSTDGLNGISQRFHEYLSVAVLPKPALTRARPVHYNTWEAVYFAHDEAALIELAEAAAEVGAERFVLDDGWFGGRRHDAAGLGDWWVPRDVYPCGLGPLADKVRALGMEFGIWFEPEMVNPDSDLYRAHPDWVLGVDGAEMVPARHQLTLDLTRPEVSEYLLAKISALVREYDIAYIKWDMNRDTHLPGSGGRAVMHRQTIALYALLESLRAAHPTLEIESCASGGGRADFRILRHADRIWTSDNNDARARHAIMRGASHFFPLRVLGNHVGPKTCHITGRKFAIAFRAGSAVLGHMGMELNLKAENAHDRAVLKAAIALHKQHRTLIHEGRFWRLDTEPGTQLVGCTAPGREQALFSYTVLERGPATLPARIHFAGIDPDAQYRLRLVWPPHNPSLSAPSIIDAGDLMGKGMVVSGAALIGHGIQPPLTFPDTVLIYHLEACEHPV
ncbi:alpha-galactosidase [Qipengyuania sp. ASV99]|uniref:alpha-galactosidase n=1 Tax=Qipengyuania sp. ASV99 TaxID=3399681 RepID=UPI003A4C5762